MTQASKKAYITTPIYYPSGKPHLGSAYTTLAADIYARFKRLDGFDVKFSTGTDEHGLKLQRAAEKEGLTPQAYVDKMSDMFREIEPIMNISEHTFIRTTEDYHQKTAQVMWQKLEEAGYIYKDSYAGWYCISDESYYTEEELVDGKSPMSGHPVEWMEEESYFFKLSAFRDKLLDLYERRPELVQPQSRLNEVVGFLKGEVRDISISRTTFDWGVPVPNGPGHVMYVWIDALTNYLSVLGWPNEDNMGYWPGVHLVGKDILRFHSVYWPAMLMGAGLTEEQLPVVYAHGWWTVDGDKMSKSKGNVVDPESLTREYSRDIVRYFLMREVPFGNDGDFSETRLIERTNSDLANALGNLFQRVLSMVAKNCEAKVPTLGELDAADKEFLDGFKGMVNDVRTHIDNLQFHKALDTIWSRVHAANAYMDAKQPWTHKKENPELMAHILRVLMEGFVPIAHTLDAFMPESMARVKEFLGTSEMTLTDIENAEGYLLTDGAELPKPEGVFPRIQPKEEAA